MSTYAPANRTAQWFAKPTGSQGWSTITPNCVVMHSTETFGWPSYAGGTMAPNYTVLPDIANKRLRWRAHFEDEQSSRALVNLAGGVQTNTANAVQVEMIGTCNPAWAKTWPGTSKRAGVDYLYLPDAPDWYLQGLADFARDLNRRHGIPLTSGLTWTAYPASYGATKTRMTFAQWRAFTGWCGHQHVPENDHGDPGNFPMQQVLDIAKAAIPSTPTIAPTPVQEDDMQLTDKVTTADGETLTVQQLLIRADVAYDAIWAKGVLGSQLVAIRDALGGLKDALGPQLDKRVLDLLEAAVVSVTVTTKPPA